MEDKKRKKKKKKIAASEQPIPDTRTAKNKDNPEKTTETRAPEKSGNKDDGNDEWWAPTKKQQEVAMMLANPMTKMTRYEIIKACGMSTKTFYQWVRDKRFVDYVNSMVEQYSDIDLQVAYKALKKNIKKGDMQAIRTFLELKGKLNNSRLSVRTSVPTDEDKVVEVEVVYMDGED